jgi:hypothetical protein
VYIGHAPPLQIAQRYRALRNRSELGTVVWLDREERRAAEGEG